MTPSGPHAPPTAPSTRQRPRRSAVDVDSLELPVGEERRRIGCPGDQNGKRAPSVSGSTRGDTVLSGRSHNRDWPSDVADECQRLAVRRNANDAGSLVGGAAIWTYISRRAVAGETATGRHAHSRQQRLRPARRLSARRSVRSVAMRSPTGTASRGSSRASSTSSRTWWKSPRRRARSFSRHRRSNLRIAGGVSAGSADQSGRRG